MDINDISASEEALSLSAMNDDVKTIAGIVGVRAAIEIMQALGGGTIYVPGPEEVRRSLRDERIRREYASGARVRDLCRRYRISDRTVYRVLKSADMERVKAHGDLD